MTNPQNIIPPKKGEVRNPTKGRGKGTLNRATIVRRWLEAAKKIKNPINGQEETLPMADQITLALISKALKGDVAAFKELMDSAFGKITEPIDHTSGGEKINVTFTKK